MFSGVDMKATQLKNIASHIGCNITKIPFASNEK